MARHTRRHTPLTRDQILQAALVLADTEGLPALSMRRLGQVLGVEAMSLYNHVAGKDDVLNGIIDLVIGEIALPTAADGWRAGMTRRAHAAREVLRRHPWALGLLESRPHPGPASLRYHDAVLGCLRGAGFSLPLAASAFSLLDSYIYGFAMQEAALPFSTPETLAAVGGDILAHLPVADFPHLTEMITDHALQPGYSYAREFSIGLELLLDALAQRHAAEAASAGAAGAT